MNLNNTPVLIVSHPNSGAVNLRDCIRDFPGFVDGGEIIQLGFNQEKLNAYLNRFDSNMFVLLEVNYEESCKFLDWAIESRMPIVHLIRDNTLDCLIGQLAELTPDSSPNIDSVIVKLSQMRSDVVKMQEKLAHANVLELKYDQLRTPNGSVSRLAIHQICCLLGLDSSEYVGRSSRIVSEPNQEIVSRMKLSLRPALTRNGFGNLFDLPRAA